MTKATKHTILKGVTADTLLSRRKHGVRGNGWEDVPVKDIAGGDTVLTYDEHRGRFVSSTVRQIVGIGRQSTVEFFTRSGKSVRTTANYSCLALEERDDVDVLQKEEQGITANKKELSLARILTGRRRRLDTSQLFYGSRISKRGHAVKRISISRLKSGQKIATVDGWETVVSVKEKGPEHVYDIEVAHARHFVANGIVIRNTTKPIKLLHFRTKMMK